MKFFDIEKAMIYGFGLSSIQPSLETVTLKASFFETLNTWLTDYFQLNGVPFHSLSSTTREIIILEYVEYVAAELVIKIQAIEGSQPVLMKSLKIDADKVSKVNDATVVTIQKTDTSITEVFNDWTAAINDNMFVARTILGTNIVPSIWKPSGTSSSETVSIKKYEPLSIKPQHIVCSDLRVLKIIQTLLNRRSHLFSSGVSSDHRHVYYNGF